MHLHSQRYESVKRLHKQAWDYLIRGEEVPSLLESQCEASGINMEHLRGQVNHFRQVEPPKPDQ